MSALSVTLGADITGLVHAMGKASHVVGDTARKMHKATGSGFAGIGKAGGAALMGGLGLVGAGITATIGAALAGGAAAMGVGVKSVMSAANFEQTKVAFTTLIGDAATAEQTLTDLKKLGADTPFEFPELADAGRKLIAFGEGADTVTDTLRRIGDVSSGIQAPIGEIAEIYGKARVQGRLFAEDINQLTGRGIPIIGQLAKQFKVGDSEVRKLVESGKVGFPQIEQAFIAMTSKGGQFYGMMDQQSKTTKGLWSTLLDGFNEVFLALGEPMNDAIRPLIAEAIDMVAKLTPMAVETGKRVKEAIQFVIAAFKSGQVLSLVTASLKLGFVVAINSLINGFRFAISFFYYLITDGAMWMKLATVLIGVAGSFAIALLNAFEMPITYLKAGIMWCTAWMLKGLLQIPGMSKLIGMESEDVPTNFKDILAASKEDSGSLFGINYKDWQEGATQMMSWGGAGLADSVQKATAKAMDFGFTDQIDTKGLRREMTDVVESIKDAIPPPEEVEKIIGTPTKASDTGSGVAPQKAAVDRLDPVVTTLGKVGGGGYGSGFLDMQRENNRLTRDTNLIITGLHETVRKLSGGRQAAFG